MPYLISFIITILWVVGVTNAINWIDGLDGLLSGTSIIMGLGIALVGLINNNNFVVVSAFSIIASCAAF